ncbi:unnamed protein product [Toxocara canis]|uniref:DUF3105 domain-containing protein n=1 Tax=Toxocara canis TaxID=6265 RepID=A0A183U2J1_TOXCA|nr:unnamed protein product [Toxocara canis]
MWVSATTWLVACFLRFSDAYFGPLMGISSVCDDAKDELEPVYLAIPGLDPTKDVVWHKCMNESIFYDYWPPLRGDHRPNWAVYGEYLFLPPQRWLHNLEHGAIVLLYHPCANVDEVDKLRRLVRSCLYRHIITPYNLLSPQRQHAKVAPENLSKQGIYDYYLIRKADVVNGSDIEDSHLCPNF